MATDVPLWDTWLTTIRTEGGRLAALPASSLPAPVPTLPEWTVERVVRHTGRVHRWVTGLLTAPVDTDPDEIARAAPSLPHGPSCLEAYRASLEELVDALERSDPHHPVPSFIGPADVAFWARRQAHETTVHRVDADDAHHAAGGPPPDPPDAVAAADGVAEWVEVFAGSVSFPEGLCGRRIGFRCDDVDGRDVALVIDTDGTAAAGSTIDGADAVLHGAAADLLLVVWRRRPPGTITVDGDVDPVGALVDTVRV